ncbi:MULTISPECIES: S9 family peptidase [Pseudacidovorax]|uniref:alpha/beta hydrolase family protein n=1 Tax=Pseudacidovorax TaxID=433923 RepID=UPI001B1C3F44|nr:MULTISPECIES: alpha/beta fold hydrolase [Pseudacidovorax]MBO9642588.1 alpha/beta fold hydrolase [Pseudacidovorax sp.]
MQTQLETLQIAVDDQKIDGTLVAAAKVPGVLLVHGWDGSQEQYLARAREIAALGCVCLTFDLRGHARHAAQRLDVTREDNLRDVLAAYDTLAGHPAVDPTAIAIVGSSYGGYLAALVTGLRPVRWLAMRAPALYRDEDWEVPKGQLSRSDLAAYRLTSIAPEANRALGACEAFRGDVLVVESEHDSTVPHPVIANYLGSFRAVRSVTYRVLSGADHALSKEAWRKAYGALLVTWMTEMMRGLHVAPDMAASRAPVSPP